jgi:hypothetical protein
LNCCHGERSGYQICVKLGKTPTGIYEMLQTVYGEKALSHSNELEWFKAFKDGCENLQYDPRSGHPSTS